MAGAEAASHEGIPDKNASWIFDTGASVHLTSGSCIRNRRKRVYESPDPKTVLSADGPLTLNKDVQSWVPNLNLKNS